MNWIAKVQVIGTLIMAAAGISGLFLLYTARHPIDPQLALYGLMIVFLLSVVYSVQKEKKTYKHFLSLSVVGLYLSLWLSALMSRYWKYEQIVSAHSMAKVVMLMAGALSFYLAVIIVRARASYKKKIGNQPVSGRHSFFSRRSFDKKADKNGDIFINLGVRVSKNE